MPTDQLSLGIEVRGGGALLERTVARLREGPLATAAIAQEILFLRGNPSAAASAVFALLGTDDRVRVDASGVWSMAAFAQPNTAETSLRLHPWSVVDVETTGGSSARGHRVIEIGMVKVVDGQIGSTFTSLVNPGRPVPRVITSLTGISQDMLDPAPSWAQISNRVNGEMRGSVFVGHNAGFDWRFVSSEVERCTGSILQGPRICTLRLARRLLPNLESRSLGYLARYFGIGMDRHHRALDDAVATARLLLILIDMLEERDVRHWGELQAFLRIRAKRKPPRRSVVSAVEAA